MAGSIWQAGGTSVGGNTIGGITMDGDGNMLVVADSGDRSIRQSTPNHTMSAAAGRGRGSEMSPAAGGSYNKLGWHR